MGHFFHGIQFLKIITLVQFVLILLFVVPATAADIDISLEGSGISNWAFIPGITNIDSSNLTLNVSSISSTWTVSVVDNLDFSKPAGTVGKMAESDAGGTYTGTNVLGSVSPSQDRLFLQKLPGHR